MRKFRHSGWSKEALFGNPTHPQGGKLIYTALRCEFYTAYGHTISHHHIFTMQQILQVIYRDLGGAFLDCANIHIHLYNVIELVEVKYQLAAQAQRQRAVDWHRGLM